MPATRGRLALLAGGIAVVAAAVAAALLLSGPAEEDERAALLGTLETVGYGDGREGVEIRETDTGAVFAMPGGREIRVTAPAGHRLSGEFAVLNRISGGVFLEPEDGGREVYFAFVDARRPLEPSPGGAEAIYAGLADRIRTEGMYAFLDTFLPVLSAEGSADGAVYCLDRGEGRRVAGASRFVGPLAVTTMAVGPCETSLAEAGRRLDLAAEALAGNRE